jgi:hypothetical protein
MDFECVNENQKKHSKKLIQIIKKNNFAIDSSPMGCGKTKIGFDLFLSGKYDFLFYFCPANLISNIKNESNKWNCKIDILLSYESLRSIKHHQPKHKLLKRIDNNDESNFIVSTIFENIVNNNKCLIIMDEFHHFVNENKIQQAIKSIFTYSIDTKTNFLFLSGTPFDKIDQIVNFLKCVNIIKQDELYEFSKKKNIFELKGIQDLINFCKDINLTETNSILYQYELNTKNIMDICYFLYTNILQNVFSISLDSPKLNIPLYCYNKFFEINEEAKKIIDETLEEILEKKDIGDVFSLLQKSQIAKIETICKETVRILTTIPNSKVCIYYDFDKPINKSMKILKDFNPIAITGKTNKIERPLEISIFQEPNLKSRLLILNSAVGSEGINLDDTNGNFPRYVLACPNHYIKRSHQMTRRFYRITTLSSPHIYFVYSKYNKNELSILNNLAKKSLILKETLKNQVDSGMKFPIDYDVIIEGENNENVNKVETPIIINNNNQNNKIEVDVEKKEGIKLFSNKKKGFF